MSQRLAAIALALVWIGIGLGVFGLYSVDLAAFSADAPEGAVDVTLTEAQQEELHRLLATIDVQCADLLRQAEGHPEEVRSIEEACRRELEVAEARYLERVAARG